MEKPDSPIEVFCSFAEEDVSLLRQLESHLSTLRHEGMVITWHNRLIPAGIDRKEAMDHHLNTASLILLFISPDFLNSEYCYGIELQQAMLRHEANEARVIPIVLRACDWKAAPFGKLQVIPRNEKPITSWHNRDEAWTDVVDDIQKVLQEFLKDEAKKELPVSKTRQLAQTQKKYTRLDVFPPVWDVPYRYVPFFTGRDHVIERVFENFTIIPAFGVIPVQALTGLGGLGKTQTAVAYAFRYRTQYQTVLWVQADTEGDLMTGFTNMAKLLALPGTNLQQRESVLDGVQRWFSNTADWLLIIDNADNLATLAPFLPTRLPNGHLLLTTRATAMDGLAQPLALTPLQPEDGALCILRRANYIPWNADLSVAPLRAREAAQTLSQLMGGLPLALEQAGAYIEATGRGMSGYLNLYEKYRADIQKTQYGDILYYRTAVAFAWNLAREVVQRESPAAIELLYLCAYLSPYAIPYELFTKGALVLGPTLKPVAANEMALDRAISLLRKYSLIKNEVDHDTDISRLFIHPVLQEILQDDMDPRTQRLWAERAVRSVAQALPFVEEQVMQSHIQKCLQLIEHWKMSFREVDLIRQYIEDKHM